MYQSNNLLPLQNTQAYQNAFLCYSIYGLLTVAKKCIIRYNNNPASRSNIHSLY